MSRQECRAVCVSLHGSTVFVPMCVLSPLPSLCVMKYNSLPGSDLQVGST